MRAILWRAMALSLSVFVIMPIEASTNTNTNVAANLRIPPALMEELLRNRNGDRSFWETYSDEISERGEKAAWHSIGLTKRITIMQIADEKGFGIHDEINSRGKSLFRSAFVNALRETTVDRLPLDEWDADSGPVAHFLVKLFRGSIGNTDEEYINPGSVSHEPYAGGLDPALTFSETNAAPLREWWKRVRDASSTKYGIRPWRSDPYAYVKLSLWNFRKRPVIADTRIRLYSDADSADTLIRLQEQIRIPIADLWSITLGGSVFPVDMKNREWDYIASVRLQCIVKKDKILWYVGTSSRREEGRGNKRTETGFICLW